MKREQAERINTLMADVKPTAVIIDRDKVLRIFRVGGRPVLADFQHVRYLPELSLPDLPVGDGCNGVLAFDPDYGSDVWSITEEPLTLSPSLLCKRCGAHGFIRDGKWVPA